MDDLTAANYRNLNRSFGLNFDQMKVCLRTLAAWHAASVQLVQMVRSKKYEMKTYRLVCRAFNCCGVLDFHINRIRRKFMRYIKSRTCASPVHRTIAHYLKMQSPAAMKHS